MLAHVIINNIKVVGIFAVVWVVSFILHLLIWNYIEGKGSAVLTGIVTSLLTIGFTLVYYIAARVVIESTGNVLYDALSFGGIIAIYVFVVVVFYEHCAKVYFPYLFFIIAIDSVSSAYLGLILASLIPMTAVFWGIMR